MKPHEWGTRTLVLLLAKCRFLGFARNDKPRRDAVMIVTVRGDDHDDSRLGMDEVGDLA
jgi:hypothetical protein